MSSRKYRCLGACLLLCYSLSGRADDDGVKTALNRLDNVRGVIQSVDKATISGEINARIQKIPFKVGERFRKGETLVQFDCSLYQARLAEVRATLKASMKTHENNRRLMQLDALGTLDLALSEAEMEKAKAAVRVHSVQTSFCTIRAPYDGYISETYVNTFENATQGNKLLDIVADHSLEIELIIPSNWLAWLAEGDYFHLRVDELEQVFQAKISRFGPVIEPVSQTIKAIAKFVDDHPNLLPGMSGTAQFNQKKLPQISAHK